jgi:hypothetical protein
MKAYRGGAYSERMDAPRKHERANEKRLEAAQRWCRARLL